MSQFNIIFTLIPFSCFEVGDEAQNCFFLEPSNVPAVILYDEFCELSSLPILNTEENIRGCITVKKLIGP